MFEEVDDATLLEIYSIKLLHINTALYTLTLFRGGILCTLAGRVVQNYPKSSNKGDKLISHKTYQNTSPL